MGHVDASRAAFERELTDFASNLRKLQIDCGDPSQRAVSRAAPQAQPLSPSAISEALAGKRLPSLDFLIALVRTLLSLSSDSRSPVSRSDPKVESWRAEWTRLARLRTEARHAPSTSESVRTPVLADASPTALTLDTPGHLANSPAPMSNYRRLGFRLAAPALPHSGFVWAVAFRPAGNLMATASAAGVVTLWDPATHQTVGERLTGRKSTMRSVVFSPDGALLATAGDDGEVRVWDLATHEEVKALPTTENIAVTEVAFSPDGILLAAASFDGMVRLWDLTTHRPVDKPLIGHDRPVTAVAFSPDGTLLATASFDGMVRLWDLTTHRAVGKPLIGHAGPVRSVAFSPNGDLLATASDDGMVRLWDPT
ncbi:WD40 repeat domain-containing protein, partial [Streptomyces nigrescens]